MIKVGKEIKMDFFVINGEQVKVSDATLLIGVKAGKGSVSTAAGAGMHNLCRDGKSRKSGKEPDALYPGPNCVMR